MGVNGWASDDAILCEVAKGLKPTQVIFFLNVSLSRAVGNMYT